MCLFCDCCDKHKHELNEELKRFHADFEQISDDLQTINTSLLDIRDAILKLRNPVFKFQIQRIGARNMNINPGQSTVLTAVPLDAQGNPTVLPSGDVPNWSVSDASKVTAAPSADGLSLNVTVNPGVAPGDVVFTIADSVIPSATGTFTLTITGAAAQPVASFSVTGSAPAVGTSNFKR